MHFLAPAPLLRTLRGTPCPALAPFCQAAEILQMLDKMVGMRYPLPEGVEVSREL